MVGDGTGAVASAVSSDVGHDAPEYPVRHQSECALCARGNP